MIFLRRIYDKNANDFKSSKIYDKQALSVFLLSYICTNNCSMDQSKKRHIAKAITWRLIASATTFTLAYLFFKDNDNAIEKASGVALAESVIKMVLYYFHERAWYRTNFGLDKKKRKSQ